MIKPFHSHFFDTIHTQAEKRDEKKYQPFPVFFSCFHISMKREGNFLRFKLITDEKKIQRFLIFNSIEWSCVVAVYGCFLAAFIQEAAVTFYYMIEQPRYSLVISFGIFLFVYGCLMLDVKCMSFCIANQFVVLCL